MLLALHELATRINSHGGVLDGDSMVERYKYFVEHSDAGKDCSYARKCKDLFLRYDYEDIKKLLVKTLEQFRIIEGSDFGK